MNPFLFWSLNYHPYNTVFRGFLTRLDISILRLTCKSLNELLGSIVFSTPEKHRFKITDVLDYQVLKPSNFPSNRIQAAINEKHFRLAAWLKKEGFPVDLGIDVNSVIYLTPIVDLEEEKNAQKTLLNSLIVRQILLTFGCAANGNLEMLQHFCKPTKKSISDDYRPLGFLQHWDDHLIGTNFVVNACIGASLYGHVEILRWIDENQLLESNGWHKQCAVFAAAMGRVNVLEFFKGNEILQNPRLFQAAAYSGQLEVVKFLQKNGTPWFDGTCYSAAQRGHLDIIKWAIENGCPFDKNDIVYFAAENGSIHILEWCRDSGIDFVFDSEIWISVACSSDENNIHVLDWLVKNKIPFHHETSILAAETSNIPVLEWLVKNGYPIDPYVCVPAIKTDDLNLFKWSIDNKCPLPEKVTELAVHHGSVKIFKWILGQGYEWPEKNEVIERLQNYRKFILRRPQFIEYVKSIDPNIVWKNKPKKRKPKDAKWWQSRSRRK